MYKYIDMMYKYIGWSKSVEKRQFILPGEMYKTQKRLVRTLR